MSLKSYAYYFLKQIHNVVKMVTKEYLDESFSFDCKEIRELKENICCDFHLNTEQKRAFSIITNHATCNASEHLQMYLGGMAGTGKSQVIKAVTKFFSEIGQSGQIVLLAPTGSAAAMIGGSTYHSFLGVGDNRKMSLTRLAKIREKIGNIKYVFIDEVSMISCFDMYRISAQLAQVMNEFEEPFGGMNMIFAGDFAQLPPVGKVVSLYGQVNDSTTVMGQKNALGKALWHQTTTVVILRQNMRQKSQTPRDSQ